MQGDGKKEKWFVVAKSYARVFAYETLFDLFKMPRFIPWFA